MVEHWLHGIVGLTHMAVQFEECGKIDASALPNGNAEHCNAVDTRPRNGAGALPDFTTVDKAIGKGATIRQTWQTYAKSAAKPYSYEYFSTLYNVWCREQNEIIANVGVQTFDGSYFIPNCTADENYTAELYWKDKLDPRSSIHAL